MVDVKNIVKKFDSLEVLKGVDLHINPKEIVSIMGPSGAGKTTLLQIIGTLDRPTSGTVHINGVDVFSLDEKKISAFRNSQIGFVFQFHQLLPEFTAVENVMMPALIADKNFKQSKMHAMELLEYLGLESRAHHKPAELSGGEKQKVDIIIQLAIRDLLSTQLGVKSSLICFDEVFDNLDAHGCQKIIDLISKIKDIESVFIVSHHAAELQISYDNHIEVEKSEAGISKITLY